MGDYSHISNLTLRCYLSGGYPSIDFNRTASMIAYAEESLAKDVMTLRERERKVIAADGARLAFANFDLNGVLNQLRIFWK